MKSLIRILYVDESTSARSLVRQTVEQEPGQFELVEVSTKEEFQSRLEHEHFDVLLLGYTIGGEAVQLLKSVQERTDVPPAVLLANTEAEELALQSVKNGVADYVIRTPARIQRLLYSIRLAIERSHLRAEKQTAADELRHLTEQLERRVADRTAQLAAANQELEAFSYSVSHDLRAPLRAIEGFARILVEDYADQLKPDARRCVDIIVSSAEQMNRLIEDLLAFSRLTRTDLVKTNVDMTELAQSVISELRRGEPNDRATINLPRLLMAKGDPALLRQVWFNLIANAFKFTRKNPTPTIEIGSYAEGDDHVYFVKDNGVGFDMQYAHKLFNVFQRLHRSDQFEGTGVGLAIVKRVIQRHRGRVWADAKPNVGAAFYFSLPKDQNSNDASA